MKNSSNPAQGKVSSWRYLDVISGDEIEVMVSHLDTTICINERCYYFPLEEGIFDLATRYYYYNDGKVFIYNAAAKEWTQVDACMTLDKGDDPRLADVPATVGLQMARVEDA